MSTTVFLNGVPYQIPSVGEIGWGQNTSSYLIALSTSSITQAGGNFTLTNDINFGPNYGLIASKFQTYSSTPALTGVLRLAKNDTITWRNNADTADLALGIDTNDRLTFRGQLLCSGGTF